MSDLASSSHHKPAAVVTFSQVADYWLLAHALAYNCIVVTHDIPAKKSKIKLSNACSGLDLHRMSLYEMLGREWASLFSDPATGLLNSEVEPEAVPSTARERKSDMDISHCLTSPVLL